MGTLHATTACQKDSKLHFVSDGNLPRQLDDAKFSFLKKQLQVIDVKYIYSIFQKDRLIICL
jgi:hypothetical protein